MLDRPTPEHQGGPLVRAVMQSISERIASRALVPGARLPSVRKLAETLQVSKSTVVEAYERLGAEGAIASRRGSGFFVSGGTRPLSLKALGPELDRVIDPLWLTLQSFQTTEATLKPGSGWLPRDWMPQQAVQRALRQAAREAGGEAMQYDPPLGYAPLRTLLARRMGERGIAAEPDQIILTDSATQALDLLLRLLIEPGDTVLLDDPCYFNFHALMRAHRASVVSVPFTPTGPDLTAFAAVLAAHRPRLYVTNATLHNPTGASLSAAGAHRVLKLAEQHGTTIVEDAIASDFQHEPGPSLAGFDGLDRVVHIGGFSKTVSASLRSGFIAAPQAWVEPLIDLKMATSLGNTHALARLTYGVLTDGGHRRHLDAVRSRLSDATGRTLQALQGLGIRPWCRPEGGMNLWAELPDGADAAAIARFGLREGVLFAPGDVFSHARTARSFIRFNVARSTQPRVLEVLEAGLKQAGAGLT